MNDQMRMIAADIERICTTILEGGFESLDDFVREWPAPFRSNQLFDDIYEDCESGINHTPAKLLSGRIDWPKWTSSGLYGRIEIDRAAVRAVTAGHSLERAAIARALALSRANQGNERSGDDLVTEAILNQD